MRIVFFRTPKPKSFSYRPRYYDPEKAKWERKKAAHGLPSALNHTENLRIKMKNRWKIGEKDDHPSSGMSILITYAFYLFIIGGSIYVILFTDFVVKLLALFGLSTK